MAADQTLIQGAYGAAMADSRGAKHLSRAGAISGVTHGLTGMVVDYLGKKTEDRKYYDGLAQKVLDEAGDLPQEEISDLYDKLELGKQDYVWGNKKAKTLSLNNLNRKKEQYEEYSDIRELAADGSLESNLDGFSKQWMDSDRGKAYLSILEGGSRLVPKECPEGVECQDEGDMGVMIPNNEKLIEANEMLDRMNDPYDELYKLPEAEWEKMAAEYDAIIEAEGNEWTSLSAIKQEMNNNMIDVGFRTGLRDLATKVKEDSKNKAEGEEGSFPAGYYASDLKAFLSKGKKSSVAFDNHFGKTSFHDDLIARLTDPEFGGWESLGVDVKLLDPNTDGDPDIISPEDADFISRTLINDETYSNFYDQEIEEYFMGHLGLQWDYGTGARNVSATGWEQNRSGRRTKVQDTMNLGDDLNLDDEDDFNEFTLGSDRVNVPENFTTLEDYNEADNLKNLLNMKFDGNNQNFQNFLLKDNPKNKKIRSIMEDENLNDQEKFKRLIDEGFVNMPMF